MLSVYLKHVIKVRQHKVHCQGRSDSEHSCLTAKFSQGIGVVRAFQGRMHTSIPTRHHICGKRNSYQEVLTSSYLIVGVYDEG